MTKVEISIDYPPDYCSEGSITSTMTTGSYELTIQEVLNMMTHVLRGAGYCFDGKVSIVPEEEEYDPTATTDREVSESEKRRRKHFKQS